MCEIIIAFRVKTGRITANGTVKENLKKTGLPNLRRAAPHINLPTVF